MRKHHKKHFKTFTGISHLLLHIYLWNPLEYECYREICLGASALQKLSTNNLYVRGTQYCFVFRLEASLWTKRCIEKKKAWNNNVGLQNNETQYNPSVQFIFKHKANCKIYIIRKSGQQSKVFLVTCFFKCSWNAFWTYIWLT